MSPAELKFIYLLVFVVVEALLPLIEAQSPDQFVGLTFVGEAE